DNLGATLDRLGRPADALAPLENALRLDPDDGTAHNNLGAALLKLRRPAEAVPHLRRGLELMGNMAPATVYMNLGRALLETGHADEGLALLAEAVGRAPEN